MGLGDAENAVFDPIGLIRKHRLLLPVNLFDVQVFILATLQKRKGTLTLQRKLLFNRLSQASFFVGATNMHDGFDFESTG
mgnify:CR=1 FL=1